MFFRTRDPITSQLVALGVADDAAERLSRSGTLLDLPAGTTLCTQGERGRQAFFILEGEATVAAASGDVTLGAGEVVGELAVLDSRRLRNATVTASTPIAVLVFDVGTFQSLATVEDLTPRLAPQRTAA